MTRSSLSALGIGKGMTIEMGQTQTHRLATYATLQIPQLEQLNQG